MSVLIFILRLLAYCPLWLLYGLSGFISFMLHRVIGYRKQVINENLTASFPDLDAKTTQRLTEEYYGYLADQMVETVKLGQLSAADLLERVQFLNPDLLKEYESNGKNVIIMMGHSGNWEWAGAATALTFNFKMIPVYRKIKDEAMNQYYIQLRSRHGAHPMLDKEAPSSLPKEETPFGVAMLADHTPSARKGWWLTFLNQKTPFFRGSEILARRLDNCDVVFAHVRRKGRGKYDIHLAKPDSSWNEKSHKLTLEFAAFLESEIQKDKVNWLWSHKRWKHEPKNESVFID